MKDKVITAKVDQVTYDLVSEDARLNDISMSQWLNDAIDIYLHIDDITWEDLEDMEEDDLLDFINDMDLEIDPDDYKGLLGYKLDELREAIADELGLPDEDEEEEEEED
jgi:hypothetical protein